MTEKHFYQDLINTESLILSLADVNLSAEERQHLLELIDATLHHTVLDAILSELSEEDKKIFLENLGTKDHNRVWEHLHTKVEKIEDKIKTAAEELQKELHKDIKHTKK